MEFTSLSDDCLLLIFDQISLQELLRLRALNRRWNTLVCVLCRGKSTLKLFGSFRGLVDYTKRTKRYKLAVGPATDLQVSTVGTSELIIYKMTPTAVAELLKLFPNTASLVFFFYNWPPVDCLVTLLQSLSQLTSLVLHGAPAAQEEADILWTTLDGLGPKLKRLHLFASARLVIPEDTKVLAGLEHFSLTHYEGDVVPVLAQLGPACKVLLLEYVTLSREHLAAIVETAPHLPTSLTHLFLGSIITPKPATQRNPPPPLPAGNAWARAQEAFFAGPHFGNAFHGNAFALLHNNVVHLDGDDVEDLNDLRAIHFGPFRAAAVGAGGRPRQARLDATTNGQQILAFICEHLGALQYLDVTFMMPISYRSYNLSQNLAKFRRLRSLTTLRLILCSGDLDQSLIDLSPLKTVRTLHLELYPINTERFLEVVPAVFPILTHLTVECYDKNNIAQLASQLSPTAKKHDEETDKEEGPFAKLRTATIYYQRDLQRYFSTRGYGAHYRTYLQEQMGGMADLL